MSRINFENFLNGTPVISVKSLRNLLGHLDDNDLLEIDDSWHILVVNHDGETTGKFIDVAKKEIRVGDYA